MHDFLESVLQDKLMLFLASFGGVWLALLLYKFVRLAMLHSSIRKATDADFTEELTRYVESGANGSYDDVIVNIRDHTIKHHLLTIIKAGGNGTSLNVGEFTRHTISRISNAFPSFSILRTILAVFLIIGLLGTLWKLSSNLGVFGIELENAFRNRNTNQIADSTSALLETLQSAFYPSVLGVSLTIIGTLLFGGVAYYADRCVKNKLENVTLTVWAPLFLSADTRCIHDFTERIKNDSNILEERLPRANEMLESMSQHIDKINTYTNTFVETADNLSKSQPVLLELGKSVDRINVSIDKMSDYIENVDNIHNNTMDNMVKMFEDKIINPIVSEFSGVSTKINEIHTPMIELTKDFHDSLRTTQKEFRNISTELKTAFSAEREQIQKTYHNNNEVILEFARSANSFLETRESYLKLTDTAVSQINGYSEKLSSDIDTMRSSVNELTQRFEKLDDTLDRLTEAYRTGNFYITTKPRWQFWHKA